MVEHTVKETVNSPAITDTGVENMVARLFFIGSRNLLIDASDLPSSEKTRNRFANRHLPNAWAGFGTTRRAFFLLGTSQFRINLGIKGDRLTLHFHPSNKMVRRLIHAASSTLER
jgi:hypothetical protein